MMLVMRTTLTIDPEQVSTDLAPHQCPLPRLAPVELESPGD